MGQPLNNGIYEQSSYIAALTGNTATDRITIEENLLAEKKRYVERYTRKIISEQREWYEQRILKLKDEAQNISTESATTENRMDPPGVFSVQRALVLSPESGIPDRTRHKISEIALQTEARALTEHRLKSENLLFQRDQLLSETNLREPYLWDYEIRYLLQKRFMQKDICSEIERILLEARCRDDDLTRGMQDKINRLLRVPYHHRLLPEGDIGARLRDKRTTFMANPELASIPEERRDALWSHVAEPLVMTTARNLPPHSQRRKCFYFQGPPGSGKTYAAKKIPISLQWTWSAPDICTDRSFSRDTIHGTHDTPGIILEMYSDTESGVGAPSSHVEVLNAVVILNDFDRMLLSMNPAQADAALSFLQLFLESDLMSIPCPYINGRLKIEQLSVIITGNHDLRTESVKHDRKFDALLSRMSVIDFSAPTRPAIYRMLLPSIQTQLNSYGLIPPGTEHTNATAENHQLIALIKSRIESVRTPRDLRAVLHDIIPQTIHTYLRNPEHAIAKYSLTNDGVALHDLQPLGIALCVAVCIISYAFTHLFTCDSTR